MKGVEALAEAICTCTDRQYTVPGFPVTELGAAHPGRDGHKRENCS